MWGRKFMYSNFYSVEYNKYGNSLTFSTDKGESFHRLTLTKTKSGMYVMSHLWDRDYTGNCKNGISCNYFHFKNTIDFWRNIRRRNKKEIYK